MYLWSRWPVFDTVLVNLTDGSAIKGVLTDKRGPLIVLAHAEYASSGEAQFAPMDGQVFIERRQIAFIQRPER